MAAVDDRNAIGEARRWAILLASTIAQTASAMTVHGAAFLIPALHSAEGMTLARGGLVAAAPTVGVMLALVAWGWLCDRRGERLSLLAGLAICAIMAALAAMSHHVVLLGGFLLLGGIGAASSNAASGRVVVGWFPPHRRGLAMGVRQMAQPAGVGLAAITMAVVAQQYGPYAAMWVPAGAAAVSLVAVAAVIVDPPRPQNSAETAPNPYRGSSYLSRIHAVGFLMVVPQFVVWTFTLVWLVQDRGWSPASAGALVAATQVLGALGRIGAGQLSDVVRSRVRPLRWVTVAVTLVMLLFGLANSMGWLVAVPLAIVAGIVTVAPNGLAFTAVAERAGPFWSGRSLGIHNTAQFLCSSIVPPLGGLAIAGFGYSATYALAAFFPLVAIALTPIHGERELS